MAKKKIVHKPSVIGALKRAAEKKHQANKPAGGVNRSAAAKKAAATRAPQQPQINKSISEGLKAHHAAKKASSGKHGGAAGAKALIHSVRGTSALSAGAAKFGAGHAAGRRARMVHAHGMLKEDPTYRVGLHQKHLEGHTATHNKTIDQHNAKVDKAIAQVHASGASAKEKKALIKQHEALKLSHATAPKAVAVGRYKTGHEGGTVRKEVLKKSEQRRKARNSNASGMGKLRRDYYEGKRVRTEKVAGRTIGLSTGLKKRIAKNKTAAKPRVKVVAVSRPHVEDKTRKQAAGHTTLGHKQALKNLSGAVNSLPKAKAPAKTSGKR